MVAIRPIAQHDLEQVVRIERQSFPDPYPRRLLQWLAENLPTLFLVATEGRGQKETGHELLGYVVAQVLPSGNARIGHVISIAVEPQRRREGIGAQLMQQIIRCLREQKCTQVRLEVRVKNTAALSLYEKLGFHREETLRGYYNKGEDGALLTLNLEDGK
jgi:ribosomal-protein-alanine N-acetyltransferase